MPRFQEQNRLKAKALRERAIAAGNEARERLEANEARRATGAGQPESSRKRSHAAISTAGVPATSRDARGNGREREEAIQPARKFKNYVDHDFSAMTDTKGGFLSVEDDPFNKALHAPSSGKEGGDGGKPAHMTLKEWERHQMLRDLRRRKEGPFEPGIVAGGEGKKCRECGSLEVDWVWVDVFGVAVCGGCKEKMPERYSLLTKTEAKDDYLLTDREFSSLFSAVFIYGE